MKPEVVQAYRAITTAFVGTAQLFADWRNYAAAMLNLARKQPRGSLERERLIKWAQEAKAEANDAPLWSE
jgi:hypothetical protein